RRRHTRLQGDWSSDVCSSDLAPAPPRNSGTPGQPVARRRQAQQALLQALKRRQGNPQAVIGRVEENQRIFERNYLGALMELIERSEERRVGKECRDRVETYV